MSTYQKVVPATNMSAVRDLPILMTIQQFAPVLNMSPKGVTDLCREGQLPALKIGGAWRIHRDKALAQLGFEIPGA